MKKDEEGEEEEGETTQTKIEALHVCHYSQHFSCSQVMLNRSYHFEIRWEYRGFIHSK